jgi:hypothetical protein
MMRPDALLWDDHEPQPGLARLCLELPDFAGQGVELEDDRLWLLPARRHNLHRH